MKKFNFNLDALLKLRKHREMQAQLGYAEIQRVKTHHEYGIIQAEQKISEYAHSTQLHSQSGTAFAFAQSNAFILDEHHKILNHQDELKKLQPMVDIKRRQLLEANQQTNIIEKLRERKEALHLEEQRQIETAAMDEIATMRFNINRSTTA